MSNITDPRPPDKDSRERQLLVLLQRVWTFSFTTKSDTARDYADEIAEGSSRSFLTTEIVLGHPLHGRLWKITPAGLQWLNDHAASIAADEVNNYVESYVA